MMGVNLRHVFLFAAAAPFAAAQIFLGSFTTRQHQVQGEVWANSTRVLEIRGFNFDGNAPAAFFWADTSSQPSSEGYALQDGAPSSSCGANQLPGADGTETFRVEFPEGTSLMQVLGGSISVWCEAFSANFGELVLPSDLEGLPETDESTLECSEQEVGVPSVPSIAETPEGFNCEPLNDDFQVRWKVDGNQLAVELVGLIDEAVYMGFGVSGSDDSTNMVGADAVVADVFNGEFRARDFYMNARAQCSNGDGVCPDDTTGAFTDDTSNVSGEQDSGVTLIRYSLPLTPTNVGENVGGEAVDRAISVESGVSTFIVWALGPVDPNTGLPFFHSIDYPRDDVSIEFGRAVENRCQPLVGGATETPTEPPDVEPFFIPALTGVTEFTARIGPSGGPRGYASITDRAAWGIAWYINDLLIPVIEMRRGTTYTFRINGGDDDQSPSEFHPLYLTTSIDGGYSQRTPEERAQETVFAGIEITEQTDDAVTGFNVQAAGPLCLYSMTDETEEAMLGSFDEFFETLDTSCADDTAISAAAATLEFTPDGNTPDLLYYQCVTHRNLGWEIKVIDEIPQTESPQTDSPQEVDGPSITETPEGYNCEPLSDDYQVRWKVDGDQVAIELVGLIDEDVYMGFGVSGSDTSTDMVGADAVVADVFEGTFRARDFYLDSRSPCSNGTGVCPDDTSGAFTDDVANVSGELDSGVTLIRYTRPLAPTNLGENVGGQTVDRAISVDPGVSTFIAWALGPVDADTGLPLFHSIDFPSDDVSIDFGRDVENRCDPLLGENGGGNLTEPPTETGPPQEVAVPPIAKTPEGYNCEPLSDNFQVRWQVDGDQIAVELLGLIDETVYMGFGVSGSDTSTFMVGADAVVADVFRDEFRARDFFMDTRAPCTNGTGVCPDDTGGAFTDDASKISGEQDSGITLVRYTRPLVPTNLGENIGGHTVDRAISVEAGVSTFVAWALGPVDPDTGLPLFHSIAFPQDDVSIEFGRDVEDACDPLVGGATDPPTDPPEVEPFLIPPLTGETEFTARIGPPGGDRGYSGITGREAFNVAWYINDLLIPVIEMRRGTTYTFRINGGDDEQSQANFHPMYLTTSIDGGYAKKTPEERAQETVFAGIEITEQTDDGVQDFNVLAAGPLCIFSTTDETEGALSESFAEFFDTLDTACAAENAISDGAATLEFTPDENTPDLLYYQCVTHRNLGWEIKVVDDPSIFEVDCSNLRENPINLTDELTLNAVIDPVENTLTAELIYDGIGWVGMGFTEGSVRMVGSEAVIGLPDVPNSQTNPGKYDLNAQAVSGVNLMGDEQQTLTNSSIIQENGQTILRFTKLLVEPNEHPISATEENTFLWAYGSDNNLAIHAARGGVTFLPAECRLFVEGVLQNPDRAGAPDVELEDPNLNRNLWVAHGVCASTAWAILVPLAVGSSLIRNVLERIGMPKGAWFMVHRALNVIAFFLTVVAFSLAVKAINDRPGAVHFSDITHHTLGLVIFILTFFQALGGILRPHLPAPVEVKEIDEEGNKVETTEATPQKSVLRRTWEIFHRLVGAALIGMAWWQVQDGFGLFARNFGEDDYKNAFWGIVGGICGCFLILFVYQQLVLKKCK